MIAHPMSAFENSPAKQTDYSLGYVTGFFVFVIGAIVYGEYGKSKKDSASKASNAALESQLRERVKTIPSMQQTSLKMFCLKESSTTMIILSGRRGSEGRKIAELKFERKLKDMGWSPATQKEGRSIYMSIQRQFGKAYVSTTTILNAMNWN